MVGIYVAEYILAKPKASGNQIVFEDWADRRGKVFRLLALYRHFRSHGGQKVKA